MKQSSHLRLLSRLKHSGMTLLILSLAFACSTALAQATNDMHPGPMMQQSVKNSLQAIRHHDRLNRAQATRGKFQRTPFITKSGAGKSVSTMISQGNKKPSDGGTLTLQQNLPETNSDVYAVAFDPTSNLIYLGGDFSYIGPHTGNGDPLSSSTGKIESGFPEVNGTIYAVAPDGSGGWYIGGDFTSVGSVTRNRLAHIDAGGNVTSWDPDANNAVKAIAVSGTTVYVGGDFGSVGGSTRNYIAALNASTGKATSWDPEANADVYALAISADGSTVYVGGDFNTSYGSPTIGGQDRNCIAAISKSNGTATSWNPNADEGVYALAVSGTTVYVGGDFRSVGDSTRHRIAAIDTSTGNATSWDPEANADVYALAVSADGNTVYVGGDFNTHDGSPTIGGQDRNYIAAISKLNGTATSWNPNATNLVKAIAVSGTTVYAGGDFGSVGDSTRYCIAAIDTSTGKATSWNPDAGSEVEAIAVSPDGSTVYAGGQFTSIGGVDRNYIAAVDASTGNVTSWNPDAGNEVDAIAISADGNTVYVGGDFNDDGDSSTSTIGGQDRNYIAAISKSDGTATSWNPNADSHVYALAVSGTTVYAGGSFTSIGHSTRNRIAAINASTGNATSWNPNASSEVDAIAVSPDGPGGKTVYAAGPFSSIGDSTRNNIAAINASSGEATSWDPEPNSNVYAIAVSADGSTVYAGGDFNISYGSPTVGGQNRNFIAAIDASTGNATGWNPDASSYVQSLAASSTTVYVGGDFTSIGGKTRNDIAAIDASTGLATDWDPEADDIVDAIALSSTNKKVYLGGGFSNICGQSRSCFAGMDNPEDVSLPVQASNFLAKADVGSVTLSWKTQSEVNNAGFNILREDPSTTGFKLISSYTSNDSLKGLGTSSTGRAYDFTDNKVVSGKTYQYKIQSVSTNGTTSDLSTLSVTVDVPKNYALYQNYPNPFNPSTTIRFDLKQISTVTLEVFNVLGQRVEYWNYGTMNAGRYNKNVNMTQYASGMFLYRIIVQGNDGEKFVSIKKLLMIK